MCMCSATGGTYRFPFPLRLSHSGKFNKMDVFEAKVQTLVLIVASVIDVAQLATSITLAPIRRVVSGGHADRRAA